MIEKTLRTCCVCYEQFMPAGIYDCHCAKRDCTELALSRGTRELFSYFTDEQLQEEYADAAQS